RTPIAEHHLARRDSYEHIFNDFFDTGLMEDELQNIQAPTLLVWGKKDQILSVSAAPIWQAGIPNCRTVIYDDLGHVPSMEDMKRTMGTLVAFVGGVSG
ncbi:MAG: alpha/beta fold hydrolase, partial [Robiginitomaculum sp.]|nr:alpha/beta fold hydrolase [Robiginitomaculum sp.]